MMMKHFSRTMSVIAVMGFGAATADAGSLTSHQAIYELSLKSASSAADVTVIDGKTHYRLKRLCDGWSSSENYAISFGFEKGQAANFISHYKTWESHENSSFTFEVLENSNTTGEASFHGFANRDGAKTEAFHSDGDGEMRALPKDTVFPVQHMMALMDAAEKGTPVIKQSHMFMGGEVSDSLYFISAVMGKKKPAAPKQGLARTMGALAEDQFWPLSIAYYKPDAQNAEPEYAISFDLQPNGIIRGYTVDYGTFRMEASLTKLEPIEPEACN